MSVLGIASSTPAAEAQQPPTPPRPLLLIGGTLVGADFVGYDLNGDGDFDDEGEVPGWDHTDDWLEQEGGYGPGTLIIGQLADQATMPADWPDRPFWVFPVQPGETQQDSWNDFVDFVESTGGSTAGLAPMQESVDLVKAIIEGILLGTGTDQIDIAAHSQAGAIARAAIRQWEEDTNPNNDDRVHTLISLGSGDYGGSVDGPEFDIGLLFNWLSEIVLTDCREDGWLPLCPDLFRLHSDTPFDYIQPDPAEPGGNPGLHKTGFYPALNNHSGQGPTPGSTSYYHISSHIWEPGGDPELAGAEYLPLYKDDANVRNWTAQEFCTTPTPPVPGYDVHHIEEWADPVMRKMMSWALGFDTIDPSDYAVCN